MTGFRSALERSRGPLASAWRAGLRALARHHASLVQARRPRSITGSVGVDEALARREPLSPRWDYGLGYRHPDGVERAHWIEVHPATGREIRTMVSKLAWLKEHLRRNAPEALAMTRSDSATAAFAWVHTGYDHVRRTSGTRRLLAQNGLKGPMRALHLP